MTIREKGYAHWDGELKERTFPWWPVTRLGIRLAFKKKYFKFGFFLSLIPAFVFLVGIYISERIEDFRHMIREAPQFLQITPGYFRTYMTGDFLLFMIVMILVFSGAGLISDDLKFNALQLYFSRPLKKKDYFIGKASVVLFFLLILTLVPGIIFIIMKLLFAGNFRFLAAYPWLILSVVLYSLLVTVFFSFYTLFLSSVSTNRRYVSILIFAVYFFSDILFGIFFGIFRDDYFSLLSLKNNLQQMGAAIFRQKLPFQVPWYLSFLVLCAVCVLAGVVLKRKVKGVEIVK